MDLLIQSGQIIALGAAVIWFLCLKEKFGALICLSIFFLWCIANSFAKEGEKQVRKPKKK